MARLGVAGGVGVGALYGVRLGEPEDHETIGAPFTQARECGFGEGTRATHLVNSGLMRLNACTRPYT
eukprot:scaffold130463_cov31-Tisochrysis_lutea.AAC.4